MCTSGKKLDCLAIQEAIGHIYHGELKLNTGYTVWYTDKTSNDTMPNDKKPKIGQNGSWTKSLMDKMPNEKMPNGQNV